MAETGPVDAEHMRTLASHGVRWALAVLEQLCGRPLSGGEPRAVPGPAATDAAVWEVGTFVGFGGDLQGTVGLLMTAQTHRALVHALTGVEDPTPEAADSALRELGNIIASQAVSAMANEIGGRVLPGLPQLADAEPGRRLASLVGPAHGRGGEGVRFEALLHDARSRIRLLLVVAVEPTDDAA
jgi:chemotaxis protein CheY-P-specific phosphatase CheC